jgi:hypothetical protein
VVAAFTRFRVVAAAAAWAATVYQAMVLFASSPTWPSNLVRGWPTLVLAASAALALTARGPARGHAVLGRRRTLLMSLSFAVLAVLPALELALADMRRYADGSFSIGAWGGLNTPGWSGGSMMAGWISASAMGVPCRPAGADLHRRRAPRGTRGAEGVPDRSGPGRRAPGGDRPGPRTVLIDH